MRNFFVAVALLWAGVAPEAAAEPTAASVRTAPSWLGVALVDGDRAAKISRIASNGPAVEAGLQVGDQIVAVNARQVRSAQELTDVVARHAPGSVVTLRLKRGNTLVSAVAVLEARPTGLTTAQTGPRTGMPAPSLRLTSIGGGTTTSLAAMKGEVVLVDVWATWCGPCRGVHDRLSTWVAGHKGNDVRIISVSSEEDAVLARHLESRPLPYEAYRDPYGETQSRWRIQSLPTLAVVGRDGTLRYYGHDVNEALATATSLARRH